MIKLLFFILTTILFVGAISLDYEAHRKSEMILLSIMYIIFVLIALYELGKDEIDKQKQQK